MPKLIVYRQERNDGGVRTGIDLDGDPLAEHFEPGGPEHDPTLRWYVDLRCEGAGVPGDPAEVEPWLARFEEGIRAGFAQCADAYTGADPDYRNRLFALSAKLHNLPDDVQMSIAFSASRREDARRMPEILRSLGESWSQILRDLNAAQAVEGVD